MAYNLFGLLSLANVSTMYLRYFAVSAGVAKMHDQDCLVSKLVPLSLIFLQMRHLLCHVFQVCCSFQHAGMHNVSYNFVTPSC